MLPRSPRPCKLAFAALTITAATLPVLAIATSASAQSSVQYVALGDSYAFGGL